MEKLRYHQEDTTGAPIINQRAVDQLESGTGSDDSSYQKRLLEIMHGPIYNKKGYLLNRVVIIDKHLAARDPIDGRAVELRQIDAITGRPPDSSYASSLSPSIGEVLPK